jgi:hypothetical protein
VSRQRTESEVLYRRALPGGGVVLIRASAVRSRLGRAHVRGEVVVERRTDTSRRAGHEPPVIAAADRRTEDAVLRELFPLASSNTAIAVACLKRQPRRAKNMESMEHAGAG